MFDIMASDTSHFFSYRNWNPVIPSTEINTMALICVVVIIFIFPVVLSDSGNLLAAIEEDHEPNERP